MKLAVGMGSLDDYIAYAKAGADEVFIGYVPEVWQTKYGLTTPLNRREVCYYNVQIGSYSELEILSDMIKIYGTAVTIAFNGLYFQPEQYPVIAEILEDCIGLGFTSVILSDLGLLVYLKKIGLSQKLQIHVSGEFGEINHLILRELVRLGATRLIFHRKVSLSNMEKIISAYKQLAPVWEADDGIACPPLEFEAFILNENCHFNGAFCNTLHCDELVPMCRMPYQIDTELMDSSRENTEFDFDYGLKNLARLKEIGITHLKIVGRGADSDYMVKCIRYVSSLNP